MATHAVVEAVWDVIDGHPEDEAVRAALREGLRSLDPETKRRLLHDDEFAEAVLDGHLDNAAVQMRGSWWQAIDEADGWEARSS